MAEQSKIVILGNRILVEKVIEEDVTSSGILLTGSAKKDLIVKGIVKGWGQTPEHKYNLDEIVYFPKYALTPIKFGLTQDQGLVEAADIVAVETSL